MNSPRASTQTLSRHTWKDFLKIQEPYKLKKVPRKSTNIYQENSKLVIRRETTAEHIYSCLKLADYFLELEEFRGLDRLKIYQLIMYHDDAEIVTGDVGISELEKRVGKETREILALSSLVRKYPRSIKKKLSDFTKEYKDNKTPEAQFAHAIDKMDALVHELQYPEDWGEATGFTEGNVREWFGPSFEYSQTFTRYFEALIAHLKKGKYFEASDTIKIDPALFDKVLPELVRIGSITAMQAFRIGEILGTQGTKSAARQLMMMLERNEGDKKS